jgi:hypothetical protein
MDGTVPFFERELQNEHLLRAMWPLITLGQNEIIFTTMMIVPECSAYVPALWSDYPIEAALTVG